MQNQPHLPTPAIEMATFLVAPTAAEWGRKRGMIARAMAGIIKGRHTAFGHCLASDLLRDGFTETEVADHFAEALTIAEVMDGGMAAGAPQAREAA